MDLQTVAQQIADRYEPPTTGRPSEIQDASSIQTFLEAVQDGNYLETACDLAGISQRAVQNWVKRGEDGEEPFKSFMRALKRASAKAEAEEMGKVRTAGKDPRFWAASMTYLERRHPDRWARRSEGTDTPKVVVQIGVKDADVQVSIQSSSGTGSAQLEAGDPTVAGLLK